MRSPVPPLRQAQGPRYPRPEARPSTSSGTDRGARGRGPAVRGCAPPEGGRPPPGSGRRSPAPGRALETAQSGPGPDGQAGVRGANVPSH